ncbi:MAG: NAD-dependent epimerase/dehydratase family protein [Candidatus Omnitrophota bacterium]
MDKNFWKDKKILITGFEGFLGSNLSKALLKTKAKVVGLDIKVLRKETLFNQEDYRNITVYKGSVTNYGLIEKILRKHSIDVVFHLAAEAIVGRSHGDPVRAFHANITGTWSVLEACRKQGRIEAVIVASSDKAYGEHDKLPYKEGYPLAANHPYDVSKSCADLIANTYAHTYGLPVVITRCGNIYGPGDFNFSRLIPDMMRCLFRDKTLLIRSDGKFVRDYVYVDDIVEGYLKAAELLKARNLAGEAFNLSYERPITVLELLAKLDTLKAVTRKPKYKILNLAKYEIRKQSLFSGKARRILKWKPKYNLEDGLKKTLAWYFNYFSK